MKARQIITIVSAACLLAAPCFFSACTPPPAAPKTAAVQPLDMPPGATWDGVYFNPMWGYLHIVAQGNNFEGRWKRADESKWGEMTGTITKDIARFDWKEYTIGMVGASGTRSGKGYFRYTRPEGDNIDDVLKGVWGYDDSEIDGGEWDSIKQRNKQPDLKSVGGEAEPSVGGWN